MEYNTTLVIWKSADQRGTRTHDHRYQVSFRKPMSSQLQTNHSQLLTRIYLSLAVLAGLVATVAILRLPSEAGSKLLLGLSGARLIMLASIWLISGVCAYLLLLSRFAPPKFQKWVNKSRKYLRNNWLWWSSIFICAIIPAGALITFVLETFTVHAVPLAYIERLRPLLIWSSTLSLLTLLYLPHLRYEPYRLPLAQVGQQVLLPAGVVLTIAILAWLWIARTGMGLSNADAGAGWNAPGAPLLLLQTLAIWAGSMLFLAAYLVVRQLPLGQKWALKNYLPDILIIAGIWLASFLIWNSFELKANWFAALPQPPNFEYYPNSDASLYDSAALNALTGNGYLQKNAPFIYRPFYALILLIFHALAGPGYESIIPLQVALLALIPVFLYLLVLSLHNRISALMVAALFIWRQANALMLGDMITYSHVKLLMSDLPTLLGVVIYLWLFSSWLEDPESRRYRPVFIGGIAGLSILIRPEFGVLLPFTAGLALFSLRKRYKVWTRGMLALTLGVLLLLAPWIWRNYQLTGTIFLDSPFYRADLFAKRYAEEQILPATPTPASQEIAMPTATAATPQDVPLIPLTAATPTPAIALQPGESLEEFTERMTEDVVDYTRQNPLGVVGFIGNHFLNSWLQSILYLPTRLCVAGIDFSQFLYTPGEKFWRSCAITENYVRYQTFWLDWSERIEPVTQVYIFSHLVIISIGVGTAWRQRRYAGLLPLVAALGYYSIHAVARNSGGRYIQPIDWFSSLYWGIGLTQLSLWGFAYLRGKPFHNLGGTLPSLSNRGQDRQPQIRGYLWRAIPLLLVGLLLPFTDRSLATKFTEHQQQARLENLLTELEAAGYHLNGLAQIETDLIFQGRALYPRIHPAGQGESGSTWPAFYAREFDRISFILAGPQNFGVVLPTSKELVDLPHYGEVLIIGCQTQPYLEAWIIAGYTPDGSITQILVADTWPDEFTCPASAP